MFSFLSFSYLKTFNIHGGLIRKSVITSKTDFQFADYDRIVYDFDTTNRIQVYKELSSNSGKRINNSFWKSIIEMSSVVFQNCYTFGAGLTFGSGGAVYVQQSSVFVNSATFSNNSAIYGGSISMVNSYLSIQGSTTFSFDTSFKCGGAIFAISSGTESEVDNDDFVPSEINHISIVGTVFDGCVSHEYHAASYFYGASNLYIYDCIVRNCRSRYSGGGFSFFECSVSLGSCEFSNNQCGNGFSGSDTFSVFRNKRISKELQTIKGGGAIVFSNNDGSINSDDNFITQDCCFNGNIAHQTPLSNIIDGGSAVGHDIILHGYCNWRSYRDSFQYSSSQSLAVSGSENNVVKSFGDTTFQVARNCISSIDSPIFTQTSSINSAPMAISISLSPLSLNPIVITPNPSIIPFWYPSPTYPQNINTIHIPPRTITFYPFPTIRPTISDTLNPTISDTLHPTVTQTLFPTVTQTLYPTVTRTMLPSMTLKATGITPDPTIYPSPTFLPSPEETPVMTPFESPNPTNAPTPNDTPAMTFDPTLQPTFDPTHQPTLDPTPQNSPELTCHPTHDPTLAPSLYPTVPPTPNISPIESPSITTPIYTPYNTIIHTNEPSIPNTLLPSPFITPILTPQPSKIETPSNSNNAYIQGPGDSTSDIPLGLIIGIVVAFVVLILSLGFWAIYIMGSQKHAESSSSALEFAEETVQYIFTAPDETMITHDNPLWTTSVMGQTDDPFRDDFEEDQYQVFMYNTEV